MQSASYIWYFSSCIFLSHVLNTILKYFILIMQSTYSHGTYLCILEMKIEVTCWSYTNKVFCRGDLFFACTMQKHRTNWLLSTQNVLITKLLNFKFYLILPAGNHSSKSLSLKHFLRLKHRKKIYSSSIKLLKGNAQHTLQ